MSHAITESVNPRSRNLDLKSTEEILTIINQEDHTVPDAVQKAIPELTAVVDVIVERMKKGGRLFYVGVGTSGRLAVQDAAECPPTYGAPQESVQAIMGGGVQAMMHPVENAEDNEEAGCQVMQEKGVTQNDVVIGISANGNAPYVVGALKEAKKRGAATVGMICNTSGNLTQVADQAIHLLTGPEVVCGSTRMKAGTAQKLALNMISTTVMVRLGHVTGNHMTSMTPVNKKLRARAVFIVCDLCKIDETTAKEALIAHDWNIQAAIAQLKRVL